MAPWRVVALIVALPVAMGAVLWGASVMSDDSRIPAVLAAAAQELGVMYCVDGKIVHGDGSIGARVTDEGTFRCTAWKMRGEQTAAVKGAVPWPTSPRR